MKVFKVPDDLHSEIKIEAARRREPMENLVEDMLRTELERRRKREEGFYQIKEARERNRQFSSEEIEQDIEEAIRE